MIHYEMGNTILLESAIRSAYRYLYKKNRNYLLESILLRFLKRLVNVSNQTQLHKELTHLKEEITHLKQDVTKEIFKDTLRLLWWVDSKLEGLDLQKVLEREMQRKMGIAA